MKNLIYAICLVLIVLLSLAPANSRSEAFQTCPSTIETKQKIRKSLAGWESYEEPFKNRLRVVMFFDGHPSKKASLKYDSEEEYKDGAVLLWELRGPVEYWLQCGYSETSVKLARRLPANISQCRVSYLPNHGRISKIDCH